MVKLLFIVLQPPHFCLVNGKQTDHDDGDDYDFVNCYGNNLATGGSIKNIGIVIILKNIVFRITP